MMPAGSHQCLREPAKSELVLFLVNVVVIFGPVIHHLIWVENKRRQKDEKHRDKDLNTCAQSYKCNCNDGPNNVIHCLDEKDVSDDL